VAECIFQLNRQTKHLFQLVVLSLCMRLVALETIPGPYVLVGHPFGEDC